MSEMKTEKQQEGIYFSPPLFAQRDQKILDFIKVHGIKHVLDVGCGECRLLRKFKELKHVELINGVDLDKYKLEGVPRTLRPRAWDHIFPREKQLTIKLFYGNILHKDDRVKGCEGVILSEIIEHLESEDLAKLPEVLFSQISPKFCIVTTPNFEYNVVFGNMDRKYRHHDHKFEWTRKEFNEWCTETAGMYNYSVEFDGVGSPPLNYPHVGFCSQIAMFKKLKDLQSAEMSAECTLVEPSYSYQLIDEIVYPFMDPAMLKSEEIDAIIEGILLKEYYYIQNVTNSQDEEENEVADDFVCIPLSRILNCKKISVYFQGDLSKLREFLIEKYELIEDEFVKFRKSESSEDEDEDETCDFDS